VRIAGTLELEVDGHPAVANFDEELESAEQAGELVRERVRALEAQVKEVAEVNR
jgi:hypothetical protein